MAFPYYYNSFQFPAPQGGREFTIPLDVNLHGQVAYAYKTPSGDVPNQGIPPGAQQPGQQPLQRQPPWMSGPWQPCPMQQFFSPPPYQMPPQYASHPGAPATWNAQQRSTQPPFAAPTNQYSVHYFVDELSSYVYKNKLTVPLARARSKTKQFGGNQRLSDMFRTLKCEDQSGCAAKYGGFLELRFKSSTGYGNTYDQGESYYPSDGDTRNQRIQDVFGDHTDIWIRRLPLI